PSGATRPLAKAGQRLPALAADEGACRSVIRAFGTQSATPSRSGFSCRWRPRHLEGTSPDKRGRRTDRETWHGAAGLPHVGRSKSSDVAIRFPRSRSPEGAPTMERLE